MKRVRHFVALLVTLVLLAGLALPVQATGDNGVIAPEKWSSTETYDWYTALEVETERTNGIPTTKQYDFTIKANVTKMTIQNEGVTELDVAVNGQRLNLNTFFDKGKGTVELDVKNLVKFGANTLEVQAIGRPNATAKITVEAPVFSARLLHTNDIHAKIDPLPKMAAYVKAAKASGGNVYFVNAGDNFSGNPVSDLNKGVPMIQALNAMGTDLMAVGNHDFDHGPAETHARRTESTFPWLSANTAVVDQSATPIQPFEPYKILTTDLGQKIAFIGLTETPPATGKKNIVGLAFTSPVAAVQQHINALRDQVNVIVVVSHQGRDVDVAMAGQITGADLILGAHSHTYMASPEVVNNIPIIQVGSDARYLSDLIVRQGATVSVAPGAAGGKHTVEIAKLSAVDAEVKGIVDHWNALMAPTLNAVIGKSLTVLDRDDRYTMDVSIGNLISDALRDYMDADLGFWNNGGIRASIPAGDITMQQVYTVLPFGNFVWKVQATGAEILDMITKSYARPGRAPQVDLQISGGTYTVWNKADGTIDYIDITVNGQPLDLNRTYTMALSDYVGTSSTYWSAPPTVIDMAGDVDAIIVGEYIKKMGTVNYPATSGRIRVKTSPTPVPVTKLNFYNSSSLLAANPDGTLTALTNQATVLVTGESTAYQFERSATAPKNFTMIPAGTPVPLAAMEQVGSGKVVATGAILTANGYRTTYQNPQWFTNLLEYLTGTKSGSILVDEGHGQYYDNTRFTQVKSFLADRGWSMTFTGKSTRLTAEKLTGVKLLLITTPGTVGAYSADEQTVLRNFVAAGGNLIIMSQTDYNNNSNPTELNTIAAGIGTVIRFNSDEVRDNTSNDGNNYSPTTTKFNAAYPALLKAR